MGTKQRQMSVTPSINVWTLGKGARGRWKLELSTTDVDEASARFIELNDAGKQAAVYELGTFAHEGEQVSGQVGFIWTESLNEYMGSEPEGRGKGWTEDFDTYVAYAYPEPRQGAVATTGGANRQPRQRYIEAPCERCGAILPMNELHRYTHEVRTGRVSGSSRTSHSTSYRSSSGSFSSGSRNGRSSTSGRTFYKTETMMLCDSCLVEQKHDDRPFWRVVWDFLNKPR